MVTFDWRVPRAWLERHHRGNRIAWQAKCWLLVAPAEDGRLARRIAIASKKNWLRIRGTTVRRGRTDGHATRKDQNIRFDASPNQSAKLSQFIPHAQHHRLAACQCNLCSERDAVAIANLEWAGRLFDRDKFVTSGENRDAGPARNYEPSTPHLRGHREFRITKPLAASDDHFPNARFAPARTKF